MQNSYHVGVLSLCWFIPDLWAGTRENYIQLNYAIQSFQKNCNYSAGGKVEK